jgi:UDP-GlcNAc:undecaprenyl-phosphate/decaprenyl-phosphate GlcNAc-1-phosphate transferase
MFNFGPYIDVLPNFLIAFALGLILTPFLKRYGLKHGFSTKGKEAGDADSRDYHTRLHKGTIPRLGEFAMLIPLLLLLWRDLNLTTQVFGIVTAILMVGISGAFDSKYHLSEFVKLYILFFASLILIFTGTIIDVHSIINFGSFDYIIQNPITQTELSTISALLTMAWLFVIPTALSYVGGVDGLSEGTSAIAILILLLIGIRNGDVLTITIGSIALGGLLGLLPYNFHPASIYSEHLIYGFLIAILAIISKGKITTSILILTVPILDFIYVSITRLRKYFQEQKGINIRMILHYLGTGDLNHLHHRLMKVFGNNPVKISLFQYLLYAGIGFVALAVSGLYLTFAILGSIAVIVLIFVWINKIITNERHKQ